jgi:uncharacterized protein (TIGR02284 family)
MADSTTQSAISTLNHLIETNKDGADGFRQAAEAVTNADAKALFTSRVPAKERAMAELQATVRQLGGDPEASGSVAAAVHRGFINIKSLVTGKDEAAIITECLRGEELAVSHYEGALKHELPADARALVRRQYDETVSHLAKVRALGDAYGASEPTVAPKPDAARQA